MTEDRITLRYPARFRRQIKVAAAEQDMSMNAWIVEAIRDKLNRRADMRQIIDENGRIGIVTLEVEDGVFAKPEGAPDQVDSGPIVGVTGRAITSTKWHAKPDGSLRGLWYDSPPNKLVTAHLQD